MNNLVKLGIFLFIFLNFLPAAFVRDTVDVGHFSSSLHMFEYASQHSFQFGVDIIDNVGPYGYLHYPYIYAGGAFWVKILWFALICFVCAYYTTSLTERFHSLPEKFIFLFLVVFFPLQVAFPWYAYEVVPRLAILFSAIYFLTESRMEICWRENVHIIFNGLFYALLTLEKASNVYYLILLVLILSTHWFIRSQWRNAFWLAGSYLLGIAAFWLAAGQHLSALPDYFESMSFFINAYQEVLGQEMGGRNFRYGIFYCSAAFVLIFLRIWVSFFTTRTRIHFPVEIFRSVLVAALFFLTWKQGVLRNNDSYGTFLYTVPALFAYLCLYPITYGNETPENAILKRFSLRSLLIFRNSIFALLLLAVVGNYVSYVTGYGHKAGIFNEFSARLSALVHYRPAQTLKDLEMKFQKLRNENALPPSLKNAMLSGRIDEFGNIPEIILLNNLNYRPRPVPIAFVVGNSALNKKNGRYYQNPGTAPDFVLLEELGPRLEDTSAYLSLLFNYQAVQTFRNWLVMEKRPDWQRIELRRLLESQARLDEWVSLGYPPKSFLWVEIDVKTTIIGKLKTFFYKPDFVRLDIILDDDTTRNSQVSLSQLKSGFLINPAIKTKNDLLTQYKTKAPWNLVKAFRIALDSPEKNRLFQQEFKVKLFVITSATLSDADPVQVDFSKASSLINLFAPNFFVAPLPEAIHELKVR